MNITIIGTGYVGLTTAACLAEMGHTIKAVDINEQKINELSKGIIPIYEPGLKELVTSNLEKNRLSFSTHSATAIRWAEIVISAVGTPPDKDHRADLSAVKAVAQLFGQTIEKYTLLITKSTVPVGTNALCQEIINEEFKKKQSTSALSSRLPRPGGGLSSLDIFNIVSNPEFLREGSAIHDTMYPDRIVIGTDSKKAKELMSKLYAPLTSQNKSLLFFTTIPSAELIKYAANSFLATKISFINEIANFCEQVGADVTDVAKAIGLDPRIGQRFLHAGIGYGGSCFPKDVQALIQSGKEINYDFSILKAVEERNRTQKELMVKKVIQHFGSIKDKKIAIWGISFKPKTDDTRYAPSLTIIKQLLELGANITAYDPIASLQTWSETTLNKYHGQKIQTVDNPYKAVKNADALLLLTEWDEFRSVDFEKLRSEMRTHVIFDGRNIYDPQEVIFNGFTYYGIGRSSSVETQNPHRSMRKHEVKQKEPISSPAP